MKSWRGPRIVFSLVLATLSLIYFVTLVWGPDEQGAAKGKNYLKDLGDQPKVESVIDAEGQGESSQEVASPLRGSSETRPGTVATAMNKSGFGNSTLRPDDLHDMLFLVRDTESRQPLAGAIVYVAKAAGEGRVLASFRVDAEGQGKLHRLPRAQYRYWVEAPGYHASEPRGAELPFDGTCFEVQLAPAAQLVGVFEGLDQKPRDLGVLHLSRVTEPEVLIVRPNKYGRFTSPELAGGTWRVAWIPHARSQPTPSMSTEITLPTGERTFLEVVLPEGAADPRHKRSPGIRLAIGSLQ